MTDFEQENTVVLDCSGLICPLPVLRARKKMKELAPGDVLGVIATDKAAPKDFETWCRETGHLLLRSRAEPDGAGGGIYRFSIRKQG